MDEKTRWPMQAELVLYLTRVTAARGIPRSNFHPFCRIMSAQMLVVFRSKNLLCYIC